jgi:predicted phosphodiesterase
MRIAALYDIHGHLPALEAVLADIDEAAVDAIVIGGDVVAGPWPAETLARLDALDLPTRWVRGNGDRELVPGDDERAPAELIAWARGRLAPGDARRLAALPLTLTLDVDGLGPVLFCHATPRNDTEIRTAISPDERWREVLAGVEERVVVCGHTHVQFDRVVDGIRVVNAGSIGMPYEDEPGAPWALLGPDVEFRRSTFDEAGARRAIEAAGYPSEWPEASAQEATEYFESIAYG